MLGHKEVFQLTINGLVGCRRWHRHLNELLSELSTLLKHEKALFNPDDTTGSHSRVLGRIYTHMLSLAFFCRPAISEQEFIGDA